MTLIIAAYGENFVILGADDRGVIQSPNGTRGEVNSMKKLAKLSKYAGVLIAGDAHAGTYLVKEFRKKKTGEETGVDIVAKKFADFCKKESRMEGVPLAYPKVSFIIAGFEKRGKKIKNPRIFVLSSADRFFLGESPMPFEIQGKPFIALYIFEKEFENNKKSVDKLSEFVAQAIFDTHRIDGDVGKPKWVAKITTDRGYEEISEENVEYKSW